MKHYSQDDWVPKLNATYQVNDDVMTYATYSEGFRSGGANALRANSVLPDDYDPDKLKNYELGLKYFSHRVARRKLEARLANLFGESV